MGIRLYYQSIGLIPLAADVMYTWGVIFRPAVVSQIFEEVIGNEEINEIKTRIPAYSKVAVKEPEKSREYQNKR